MSRRTGGRKARVGGRSERVVNAVLGAALAELAVNGYAELRVDDVAERAGVNKTTVYRRWPTKAALVGAALATFSDDDELPDSGSLRGDLLKLLRQRVRLAANPEKRAAARVLTTELDHPEVAAIAKTVRELFRRPWVRVVERAIERGEIPSKSDVALIVDVISSAVSMRLFRWKEVLGDAYLRGVVDLVLDGARNGGATSRRPTSPGRDRGSDRASS